MPPTTIPIRTNVKARLVELVVAAGPTRDDGRPVQVTFGWPGPDLEDECVWVGSSTGARSVQALRSARKRVHDEFDVDVWIAVTTPGASQEQAHERCEELAGFVCDVVAGDPHLGALAGLTGGASAGEFTIDVEPGDEGSTALGRLQIHCQASLP